MRTKLTLTLLLLNVALFSYIFYLEERISAGFGEGERSRNVFGSEITGIDHLSIEGGSSSIQWTLQRDQKQDQWRMTSPIEWPANPFAIQHILAQLHFLEAETSFSLSGLQNSGQTPGDYGLEEPSLVLTLGRGESQRKILFGAPTAVGNRLYILDTTTERIHVIPRKFVDNLNLPLEDLWADTIVDIPLFEVRSLGLQIAAPETSKTRIIRDGNEWLFEAPIQARASKNAVESLLMRINGTRITEFEEGNDPSALGLSTPSMRVTIEGNTRSQVLLLGSQVPGSQEEPRYFAKLVNNPSIFSLPGRIVNDLKQANETLRDPRFLRFDRDNLTALSFGSTGEETVSLQKLENGSWKIVRRQVDESIRLLPADENILKRIVERLEQARAIRFPSNSPSSSQRELFGFGAPRRIVTLTGDREITLLLGNETGEREVYAMIEDSPFVYTVDASLLNEIPVLNRHFRDRVLLRQPAGAAITSLRVSDIHRNKEIFEKTLPSRQTDWSSILVNEPEELQKGVLALLTELRNLRVDSYLHEEFPAEDITAEQQSSWAWTYLIEATVSLSGGESNAINHFKIYLTDRLGGRTQLGGSPELDVIFSASQGFIDAFELLSRERREQTIPAYNGETSET